MSKTKTTISADRARKLGMAVYLSGGQVKTAEKLDVTPQTVSRWVRMMGPIPEAVILWAQSVIDSPQDCPQKSSTE